MSESDSGEQQVIVVGPDGQPVAVPATAVAHATQGEDDGEGDDLRELTDLVERAVLEEFDRIAERGGDNLKLGPDSTVIVDVADRSTGASVSSMSTPSTS